MVSFSNGSLSGEVSNKRPLENGYVPKYKPRKVSAKRDFPPRCGPNAMPVVVNGAEISGMAEHKESEPVGDSATPKIANGIKDSEVQNVVGTNGVESPNIEVKCQSHEAAKRSLNVNVAGSLDAHAVVANVAGSSRLADQMESEAVGNSEMPKFAKLNEIKDSEIQNVEGPNVVKNFNIELESQSREAVNNDVDVDVTQSLDALVEKVMANVNVSKKLVVEIGPLGIQFSDEAGSHGHEAVNNPIEIERGESLDAYVGKVKTSTMNGFSNEVEELIPETDLVGVNTVNGMKSVTDSGGQTMSVKGLALVQNSGVQEAKSTLDADASVEKELLLCNPQALSSFCGGIKPETSSKPKDKFRPRRVSAFREFPPHCGRHVSLPIEEENNRVVSGNDCLNRIEKVESEPESATLNNVSERGTTGGVLANSQKGCLDGLKTISEKNETTETLNDGAGIGLLGKTAEGGLVEFENCNGDVQHDIIERIGASPKSGTISNAVIDNSTKDNGARVEKEIAVNSPDRNDKDKPERSDFILGNDSNREIVHGVMAAPNCPWRKSKVALKTSGSGPSGLKMSQQNSSQTQKLKAVALNNNLNANYSGDAAGSPGSFKDEGDHGTYDEHVLEVTPISMCKAVLDDSDNDYAGPIGNDIVVYSPGETDEMRPSHNVTIPEDELDREVVHGLMAAPNCPWRKGKTDLSNFSGEMSGEKKRKQNVSWRKKAKAVAKKSKPAIQSSGSPFKHKFKAVARKSNPTIQSSGSPFKKPNKVHISNDVDGPGPLVVADDEGHDHDGDFLANSPAKHKPQVFEVNLPRFGPNSSGNGDARNRVRQTLLYFHTVYRKFLQQEEAHSMPEEEGKSGQSAKKINRIDLMSAKVLKERGKLVNTDKMIGEIPGVEVGDEFQYRVELAVVGIHFPYQSGIDSTKLNDVPVATSIVASGGYSDNLEDADTLIYSGQGGNVVGNAKTKVPEDQKLERGNLALRNSITTRTPVRVVRGWKETKIVDPLDSRPKIVTTYIYDGLYTVTNYWTETGPRGKQVFQFELKRNPGQPELAWKELKKSSKFKTRPGVCVTDISGGKESRPICAVNTLDDEKPPPFNYTSKMMYPDWHHPKPPAGCDCTGRCSSSKKCRCAAKNGGEIPYNRNGALVETKPVVYECGPHCKCPPSCYNRVTQRGIRFQLELFKTESRGWGVRALTSIPSGSFISEYAGELLEDKEAEQRIGNDEYLFDIGQNYIDSSKNEEEQEIAAELMEEGGFTIDACQYGNVGRFINHSCSPNLHAQNVIYDHDDKKMPHIMLFAMENIPPLQELTYHYNYCVGEIRDSDGNVKEKKCYCGSAQCTGRMY